MDNFLKDVFIGSDVIVNNISGLAIRRICYIIDGHSTSNDNQPKKNYIQHQDVIYININSDDDIIKESEKILQIFNKLGAKNKLMLCSESIENSRILLCKILLGVCNIKLINIIELLLIREKQSQASHNNEDNYYQKLNDDEIELLKDYEKHIFGETSLIHISKNVSAINITPDDKIAIDLYEQELRVLEKQLNMDYDDSIVDSNIDINQDDDRPEVNYDRPPIPSQTMRLIDPLYSNKTDPIHSNKNKSNHRNADYRKIMNIFSDKINSDIIKEMLDMNMSVADIIESLSA